MLERSQDTRIAVLEKIAESHDKRITDMEDFHRDVVDRFDQKIQQDAFNQISLERTLTKAIASLDMLTTTVEKVGSTAEEAGKLASKHNIIGMTILKISSGLAVVGSAIWAAFTYFFSA